MSRAQKAKDLEIAIIASVPKDAPDHSYEVQAVFTSLQGPHVRLKTPQYEARVFVVHDAETLHVEINGYRWRFSNRPQCLDWLRKTFSVPLYASLTLANLLGATTLGPQAFVALGAVSGAPYYVTEIAGGWSVQPQQGEAYSFDWDNVVEFMGAA